MDFDESKMMLVLSRKAGERILIGENISVTVVKLTSGGVRLGIEAPAEMPIIREELKVAIEQETEEGSARQDASSDR